MRLGSTVVSHMRLPSIYCQDYSHLSPLVLLWSLLFSHTQRQNPLDCTLVFPAPLTIHFTTVVPPSDRAYRCCCPSSCLMPVSLPWVRRSPLWVDELRAPWSVSAHVRMRVVSSDGSWSARSVGCSRGVPFYIAYANSHVRITDVEESSAVQSWGNVDVCLKFACEAGRSSNTPRYVSRDFSTLSWLRVRRELL